MHMAACENNAFAITFLNRRGVDADGRDLKGQTPMHIACHYASEKAIYYLLSYTIDINGQDNKGFTPMHTAVSNI